MFKDIFVKSIAAATYQQHNNSLSFINWLKSLTSFLFYTEFVCKDMNSVHIKKGLALNMAKYLILKDIRNENTKNKRNMVELEGIKI